MTHHIPPVEPREDASEEEWDAYALAEYNHRKNTRTSPLLPWLMLLSGFFGLLAAVELTLGKITYWQNKANGDSTVLGCDVNPIVGCGTALNSPQGSIFGDIPNPIFGIIGWTLVIFFGVLVLSKVKLKEWHWAGLQLGTVFGISMVSYLQYQSIYDLFILCPWCMVTWAAMIPLFWMVSARNLRTWKPDLGIGRFVHNWQGLLIFLHFSAIAVAAWLQFGAAIFA